MASDVFNRRQMVVFLMSQVRKLAPEIKSTFFPSSDKDSGRNESLATERQRSTPW